MNTTYFWLERWGSGKKPAPKYWEGINNLLESLAPLGVDDTERIKELHHAWFTKVQEENPLSVGSLMNLHSHLTKAINIYFDGKLTPANSYRNPTGKHEIQHIALAHCKPPQDISDKHNKRSELNLLERVSNRGWIDKPYEIIERAESLLTSGIEKGIYSEMAAALCVVTGRRVREILVTAKFAPKSKYSIIFVEGKLKTRGKESSPQEIPTLIEASKVLEAMAILREKFVVDDTNFNLIEYHKDQVRRCIIRIFADLVPTIQMVKGEMRPTTHRMRAVYNCLATFFFAPPTLKDELYTKAIMAHDDGGATLNYTIYQISDEVIAAHGGKRQGVLLDREGVEVLEQFQKPIQNESNEGEGNTMDNQSNGNGVAVVDDGSNDSVSSGDNFSSQAIALLKSSKAIDICVGLMALTGRSAGELIKSGIFKPSDNDASLVFSLSIGKPETIATLISASQILQGIDRMRSHPWIKEKRLRYLSPNDIESRIAHLIDRSCKANFDITKSELLIEYQKRCSNVEILSDATPEYVSKSKTKAVRCFESDYERFQILMKTLGKENQAELMASLLDLAEEVFINGKQITKPSDDSDTQETNDTNLPQALAELEAKLRSEFGAKLEELQCLITQATQTTQELTNSNKPKEHIQSTKPKETNVDAKPRRSAEDKISHAVSGVMNYNDTIAPEKTERWHISESLIARLTGCNRPAIKKFFETYNTMISDHNHKHELADRHNTGRSDEEKELKVYIDNFVGE